MKITGKVIDIHKRRIFAGEIEIENGRIVGITSAKGSVPDQYILPGFIDAHVHIESSMMVPAEFARIAVRHGTVATVSDPHEIGNVLGEDGVQYMIDNGNQVPFKFYFGAPSCVPATTFETSGAAIDVTGIQRLMSRPDILYLAEMMNWPGVLHQDPEVMAKINAARMAGKPIDGHAPGLKGMDAIQYAAAGISTDHECFSLEEALDKLKAGMKIIIREGSAARNFETLIPLMKDYPSELMFCSDDKHPDELITGHINDLVRRAVSLGYDKFDVLRAACCNPVDHYGLDVGLLRIGDPGDFIIVRDLNEFQVKATYLDGELVFEGDQVRMPEVISAEINHFNCQKISSGSIQVTDAGNQLNVIVAEDGQIVTKSATVEVKRNDTGHIIADPTQDILKMVVVNRYQTTTPAVAFVRGFDLKSGAIASTVAHDSHNIIAVGVDDESITRAINLMVEAQGGVCAVNDNQVGVLPLPVAGLMSTESGEKVAEKYQRIDAMAREMGSSLRAPFMTLSFLALLVIPSLKLSDLGLFDGQKFQFTPLVNE